MAQRRQRPQKRSSALPPPPPPRSDAVALSSAVPQVMAMDEEPSEPSASEEQEEEQQQQQPQSQEDSEIEVLGANCGGGKPAAATPAAATPAAAAAPPPAAAPQQLRPPPEPAARVACGLCHLDRRVESCLGDILEFRLNAAGKQQQSTWLHLLCAAWAPRVQAADGPGTQHGLAMVPEEVRRAWRLRCKVCKGTGAALGCEVPQCPQTYHLPCAMLQASGGRAAAGASWPGVRFDSARWQVFCPEHAAVCTGIEDENMQAHRKNLRLHLQHGPPLSPGVAVARPVSPAGLAGSSLPAAEQAAAKRQRLAHGAPDTGVPLQPAGTGSQGRAWTNGSGGDAAGAGTPNGAGHGAQARQQGRQAGGPEQLPADVRALVAQVFGPVRPAAVPEALRYLWEEGVRQFSDLQYVDHADFWGAVPCTKLLFNKFFMQAKQSIEQEEEAAAAAAAAAAVPAAAAQAKPDAAARAKPNAAA